MVDFSVIIPAYNVEKYIKKCVDSVLNQSYKNYEIVIVNDGSTDNTKKVLNDNYKNLKIIKIIDKPNGGLSSARNEGVKKATGNYILFIDADDWWDKDLLKRVSGEIGENPDLVCFGLKKVYELDKKNIEIKFPLFKNVNGPIVLKKLIDSHLTFETAVTYAYRADFFKENDFKYAVSKYHEDFGLTPYIIAKANTVTSIQYSGYNYLQREGSITKFAEYSKIKKKAFDMIDHFCFLFDKFQTLKLDDRVMQSVSNYIMHALISKSLTLNKEDGKTFYSSLRMNKVYRLFRFRPFTSFLKRILVWINPKFYKVFVKKSIG